VQHNDSLEVEVLTCLLEVVSLQVQTETNRTIYNCWALRPKKKCLFWI